MGSSAHAWPPLAERPAPGARRPAPETREHPTQRSIWRDGERRWHDCAVRWHRGRCAALLFGAAVLVSGCAASPASEPQSTRAATASPAPAASRAPAASPHPDAAAEPDVLVEIVQLRGDVTTGHIELRVTNETDAPLTIARAIYVSSRWTEPMTTDDPATVPPGLRRNLRLQLPDATCDAAPLEHRATLLLDDGTALERVPEDPLDQLETLDDPECDLRAFTSTVAQLRWLDPSIPASGAGPAVVRLRVEPTAQVSGSLDAIDATVLLTPVDAFGTRVEQLPLELAIAPGTTPTELAIPLEPGRCDLHAIAEDKQGTMFRVRAQVDGEPVDLVLPSPDAQRNALLDWVVERCTR